MVLGPHSEENGTILFIAESKDNPKIIPVILELQAKNTQRYVIRDEESGMTLQLEATGDNVDLGYSAVFAEDN